jgi:hypothetical protein
MPAANAAPPPVQSFAEIITGLFPWLARFGLDPATKRLQVRSDGTGLDIEGGALPIARQTDFVVRLGLDAGVPSYSVSTSAPYTWSPLPAGSGPMGALLPTDAGVAVTITGGSGSVTCG